MDKTEGFASGSQTARRLSVERYEICDASGATQSQIAMPSRLWTANGAPLAAAIESAGLADTPQLTVCGVRYQAHRDLLSDSLVVSEYAIYLRESGDEANASKRKVIEAATKNRATTVFFKGETYVLQAHSIFSFRYELMQGERVIVSFKEVTPFLTFSSRRLYRIETEAREIEPLLLAFSFFLAVLIFY